MVNKEEQAAAQYSGILNTIESSDFLKGSTQAVQKTCAFVVQSFAMNPQYLTMAFTVDELKALTVSYFCSVCWQCDKHEVMLRLEEVGAITRFGEDAFGNYMYRLVDATPGPLNDPCGHFAGYLQVITEAPKQIESFRSFLIDSQERLLGN